MADEGNLAPFSIPEIWGLSLVFYGFTEVIYDIGVVYLVV